jgi:hypothetical protein
LIVLEFSHFIHLLFSFVAYRLIAAAQFYALRQSAGSDARLAGLTHEAETREGWIKGWNTRKERRSPC